MRYSCVSALCALSSLFLLSSIFPPSSPSSPLVRQPDVELSRPGWMARCHQLYLSTGLDLSSSLQPERSHNQVQTVVGSPLSRGRGECCTAPWEFFWDVAECKQECSNLMMVTVDFQVALGVMFTSRYTCLNHRVELRYVASPSWGTKLGLLSLFRVFWVIFVA